MSRRFSMNGFGLRFFLLRIAEGGNVLHLSRQSALQGADKAFSEKGPPLHLTDSIDCAKSCAR